MILESWKKYKKRLEETLSCINEDDINSLSQLIESYMGKKSEIHILGNGGSAANANHINGDFTKTFTDESNTIRINSFADNSCFLTAASNDIDFSEAFSILIPGRINKDDLIIFLSGSGNSVNLVKCARKAKENNINTFSITGYQGGELNKICKNKIHIPVKDMEIIEDLQLIIFHCIKQNLCKKLKSKFGIKQISSKYEKRIISNEIA